MDHRRVPNLMVLFSRKGKGLPLSTNTADDHPGDLETWDSGGAITHVGIVVDQKSSEEGPLSGRRQHRARSRNGRMRFSTGISSTTTATPQTLEKKISGGIQRK
jgi:Domain of unknown function (DUF1287)